MIYCDCEMNTQELCEGHQATIFSHLENHFTNLQEGAGEDWAGQFKLQEDKRLVEKYPRCLDSEENFGAEKPIGSEKIIVDH